MDQRTAAFNEHMAEVARQRELAAHEDFGGETSGDLAAYLHEAMDDDRDYSGEPARAG